MMSREVVEAARKIQNLVVEACARIADGAAAYHDRAFEDSDARDLVMTEADCHRLCAGTCHDIAKEIRRLAEKD